MEESEDSPCLPIDGGVVAKSIVQAYASSGCRCMADFLVSSSFAMCLSHNPPLRAVALYDDLPLFVAAEVDMDMVICVPVLREQEEAGEAGSFVRFLRALPTSTGASCLTLRLWSTNLSVEELSVLWDGIASPLCYLTSLCIFVTAVNIANQYIYQTLLWRSTTSCPITSLDISFALPDHVGNEVTSSTSTLLARGTVYYVEDEVHRILMGLSDNTLALTHLRLDGLWPAHRYITQDSEEVLVSRMLETNTSLQDLELHSMRLPGRVVEALFISLSKNTELRRISLKGCHGENWPHAGFVIDSLRAHGLLTGLDLDGTPLQGQSAAAIEAQLHRNARNVHERETVFFYKPVFIVLESAPSMRVQVDHEVEPSTVRLFLCGLPYSGIITV